VSTADNLKPENVLIAACCIAARDCTHMEEAMKQFCLGVVVAIGLTLPAFGQAPNPLLGTWKLNVAKSTFSGAIPKSGIATYEPDAQGVVKDTGETVDAQGQTLKFAFTHIWDGKPHPVTGISLFNEVTYNRLNANTVNWVRSKDGKAVSMGSLAVADDGKSHMVTNIFVRDGQLVREVTVWEKQ
jgi:hypothetical protein